MEPKSSRPKVLERLSQIRQAFVQTRAVDPKLVPLLAGATVVLLAAGIGLGFLLGNLALGVFIGITLALLVGLGIFGRRSSTAAIASIEGQPGAAAAVLQSARGWRVTPAVAFTRKQDFVHRAVGRPGVVLVGEGSPARVTSLLRQEHRRIARVVGETPVHEVSVGTGKGQVPLKNLQSHMSRFPRKLKSAAVSSLDTKLNALSDNDLPLPKGPLPRMKRR